MQLTRRPIDSVVVHHSASARSTTTKAIGRWHAARFQLGIGYHIIIEHDGWVLTGRRLQRMGAHARGSNLSSIGICVVGDNTTTDQRWSKAQHDSLKATILWLEQIFNVAHVVGHRDTEGAATECPGLDMRRWLSKRGLGRLNP